MSEEAKHELNEMSIEELYNLLVKVEELKDLASSKIKDVKVVNTKSTKRGTRN